MHAEELRQAVLRLSQALRGALATSSGTDAILLSHWEAQSYKSDQYVDLIDLCLLLEDRVADSTERSSSALGSACGQVRRTLDSIVLESRHVGPEFQYSRGLSIYFPWADISPEFTALDFAGSSGWSEFLADYVKVTRRTARRDQCPEQVGVFRGAGEPIVEVSETEPGSVDEDLIRNADHKSVPPHAKYVPPHAKYVPPHTKYVPPHAKYVPPHAKYVPPHAKGKSEFVRMKNPARVWCPPAMP